MEQGILNLDPTFQRGPDTIPTAILDYLSYRKILGDYSLEGVIALAQELGKRFGWHMVRSVVENDLALRSQPTYKAVDGHGYVRLAAMSIDGRHWTIHVNPEDAMDVAALYG